jgi:hypothetical protein
MELKVQIKAFDPDALSASIELTGRPYGMLAGRQRVEEVWLRKLSAAYNGFHVSTLPSCDRDGDTSLCANLRLYVGQSRVQLGSGNVLGYTHMAVGADTSNGLDYYPFDTYSVSGTVEVSNALCWWKAMVVCGTGVETLLCS